MLNIDLSLLESDTDCPYYSPDFADDFTDIWRYHPASQTLYLANSNNTEKVLKLYRIRLVEARVELLHSVPYIKQSPRWNTLHMSEDGQYLVASFNEAEHPQGGANQMFVIDEGKVVMEYVDPPIKLRYTDHGELDMFFGVMHPDNLHYIFWSYGEQRLCMVHLPTGQTVKKRRIDTVSAINVSPRGDMLVIGTGLNDLEVLSFPGLRRLATMDHFFGYYDWGDIGVGINQSGDTVVSFSGKYRSNYMDINVEVADRDSHLVMWRKDEEGNWKAQDAHHFKEGPEDMSAGDSFEFKSIGENIYFIGALDDVGILWMEFPSLKKRIYPAKYFFQSSLFFNADASVIYYGGAYGLLREIPVLDPAR